MMRRYFSPFPLVEKMSCNSGKGGKDEEDSDRTFIFYDTALTFPGGGSDGFDIDLRFLNQSQPSPTKNTFFKKTFHVGW